MQLVAGAFGHFRGEAELGYSKYSSMFNGDVVDAYTSRHFEYKTCVATFESIHNRESEEWHRMVWNDLFVSDTFLAVVLVRQFKSPDPEKLSDIYIKLRKAIEGYYEEVGFCRKYLRFHVFVHDYESKTKQEFRQFKRLFLRFVQYDFQDVEFQLFKPEAELNAAALHQQASNVVASVMPCVTFINDLFHHFVYYLSEPKIIAMAIYDLSNLLCYGCDGRGRDTAAEIQWFYEGVAILREKFTSENHYLKIGDPNFKATDHGYQLVLRLEPNQVQVMWPLKNRLMLCLMFEDSGDNLKNCLNRKEVKAILAAVRTAIDPIATGEHEEACCEMILNGREVLGEHCSEIKLASMNVVQRFLHKACQ